MMTSENILFWLVTACYLSTFVAALFYTFFPKPRLAAIATWSLWGGFLIHLGLFGWQWYWYQHLPHHKPAIITIAFFLLLQWKLKDRLTHIAIFTSLIALLALFFSNRWDPARPLSTAYYTRWLFVHMVSAWFAFGSFGVATALAASYLVKLQRATFLPHHTLELLDKIMYKLVAVGVLFHMVMVIAGSIWAKKLVGRYWGWDPVETWSFLVFVFYMLYIHAPLLLQLKGKWAAWLLILGLILLGISLWGIPFLFPNTHIQAPMDSFKP